MNNFSYILCEHNLLEVTAMIYFLYFCDNQTSDSIDLNHTQINAYQIR